ncbi:MAG TPA: PD-(D/E)XK nuclease family protein [Casimicrobiaceae bacterium]|nr:PD-(D/E)XK nuclease family protein [Casimicrobiaceae bacterium]
MTIGRGWKALPSRLRAALATGATIVTPNNRLARRLAALYDDAQRAAGRLAWEAPLVLPWSGWLVRLWQDAATAELDAPPPHLITAAQGAFLWKRVVATDRCPRVDEGGLSALAADAWSILHAWGAGGEGWRGWTGGDDDRQAFVNWADDYSSWLAGAKAIDLAQLPDWLARRATTVGAWRDAAVTLAGFIDESPQQRRLADALGAAGMRIDRLPSVGDTAGAAARVAATTARDEAMRALQWARERTLADPDATIAVVIDDIASRCAEIRALADDVLCPALQWPGREEGERPYEISLGAAASSIPLLAAALDLIALAQGPLPTGRAAALLRSPYLAGAGDAWTRRASVERGWLKDGRRDIALDEAIATLAGVDRGLFDRWRGARDAMPLPGALTPREWTGFWSAWLGATGWPGDRQLSSAEWQARQLWDSLLGEFAGFGMLAPRISAADAVRWLAALADDHVFQPESPAARVQILGGLEAAGLPLDALWITGLAAEAWPRAPRPNPLLPLAWQRERNAPHATAARELAYAQALTAQWAHGAAEVVFSHARNADDHERSVSLLVQAALPLDAAVPHTTAELQFTEAPKQEATRDDHAPTLEAGTRIRGGANLLDAQSNCPFQAIARFRLGVERWPRLATALLPAERGILVHAALASFWREVRDHAALVALAPEALGQRIAAAAEGALGEISSARWRRIPRAVRAGEAQRIAAILRDWIEAFERPRPAFRVEAVELERVFTIDGTELALRIDRVDRLANGGLAVIDYKTGEAKPPTAWFDPRPQASQIGVYVLAERAQGGGPIRAAAYGQLKSGAMGVRGLAADDVTWPALPVPASLRGLELPDWNAVESRWVQALGALATEVGNGYAPVAPRDRRNTCNTCGRQALCRIGAPATDDIDEGGDG